MDLQHSGAGFVQAYPAETEAFCAPPVAASAFLGGVPLSILYDNTKLAVARMLGDGRRQRTRVLGELQSHYLFADRFGRPGKGNDKGKVEGLVAGPQDVGARDKPAHDTRVGFNANWYYITLGAILWILLTGAPWRDLPAELGNWNSVWRQFRRWCESGIWDLLLQAFADSGGELDMLQIIDATIIRTHSCAVGKKRDSQSGSWPFARRVHHQDQPALQRSGPSDRL